MRKYIIIAAIALVVAAVATVWVQHTKIEKLTDDRDRYRTNTETLLQDVHTYRTKDSLNAAKVGSLELTLAEYERFRADDAALIKTLQIKNRDLEAVTAAQMETITDLRAAVRDSIVYLPGDTVPTVVKCIDYNDKWTDISGCVVNDTFAGRIIMRDSILIAETVEYKRFLGFLWRTKKIKNREFDIISRNPHTKILGFSHVLIEK